MRTSTSIFLIIFFSVLMIGCTAMTEQARKNECNMDAAYAHGVNDAQQNSPMMSADYRRLCQGYNVQALNNAYRKGYMTIVKSKSLNGININIGSSSHQDQWGCIDMPFKSVCGYGCLKTPFNKAYCGAKPGDNCVINRFNQVKCGRHCHVTPIGNEINCDIERYSKSSDHP